MHRWLRAVSSVVGIGAAAIAVACQSPLESIEEIRQEYVFQVEYRSAWFPTLTGIVIDREGRVLAYALEDDLPARSEQGYTRAELEAKYGDPSERTRIDTADLLARVNQALAVGERFRSPNLACNDAGVLEYAALRLDPATDRYHPILLRSEGDRIRQNVTGGAEELAEWLRDLLTRFPVEGLQPFPEGSCVP